MKKLITLALATTLILAPISKASAHEITEPQTDISIQTTEIGPLGSSVVNKTILSLTKDACSVTFTFLQSTSGGITATLEKQSGSSWIEVAENYDSMSFAKSKVVKIPVSSLSAGKYRVSAYIYAVIAGTEYSESVVSSTVTLN